jgi:hypothetical protein
MDCLNRNKGVWEQGNKEQGTRNKEQGTREFWEQGNKEQGTREFWEQGNKEQGKREFWEQRIEGSEFKVDFNSLPIHGQVGGRGTRDKKKNNHK